MSKQLDLSKEKIPTLFIKYAIPAIIGMLVSSFYIVIDGIFVGNGVGPRGLAAVNIAMPFVNFGLAISIMIAVGGGTLTSIELGKKDLNKASQIFSFTFFMLIGLSVGITVIAILFMDQLIAFLGASKLLAEDVKSYLSILVLGNVFFMGNYLMDMGIRSMGSPNYSMICMVGSSILNVILDYVFIMKLHWGVEGAAAATAISQLIGFIVLLMKYFKSSTLRIVKPSFNKQWMKRILWNGFSEWVTEMSVGVTTFLFNLVLMHEIGEMGVSAYSIISYISTLILAIIIGISQAIQPIISYNYGAGQNHRVSKVLSLVIKVILVIGMIATILLCLCAKPLIRLFTHENMELVNMTVHACYIYAIAFLFNGMNIVGSAYFTAMDNPKRSAAISILRGLVLIGIGLFILPKVLGTDGIWLAVPFAEMGTLLFSIIHLSKSMKDLKGYKILSR